MLTASEITALNLTELENEIKKESSEYFRVQMAVRLRQERNTAKKKTHRRYLARLFTARTRKLSENLTAPSS